MSEAKGFLATYHTALTQAGADSVTIGAYPDRAGLVIHIRLRGRRAVHHITVRDLRQGTAEQGEEAARAVLKELGWQPEK